MKSNKYWFAPKVYGWGYVPTSWEGFLITLFVVALIVIVSPYILGPDEDPELFRVILFFVVVLAIALTPILLCRSKMKGTLKWRWGVKDIDWK